MSQNSALTISLIVPVHKGGEDFRHCLRTLAATIFKPDEILIIADGGMAGTPHPDESLGAKIIELPLRCGPIRARNVGASNAKGDILLFVDADVAIQPNTIQKVMEAFASAPELAAVFGSYDDRPAKLNFLSQYRNLLHHHVHQTGQEDASTFWSGCGAIRREIFLELGGFSESLYAGPAIEDIELGYRLKEAGHKIQLCKRLQVKHLKRWSPVSLLKTDIFHRALPWAQLILSRGQFIKDLNLKTSDRLSVISVFALLAASISVVWHPAFLLAVAGFASALLVFNKSLYIFFWHRRGFWFTLRTLPWHWLFYLYSGAAFSVGFVRHLFLRGATINVDPGSIHPEKHHKICQN